MSFERTTKATDVSAPVRKTAARGVCVLLCLACFGFAGAADAQRVRLPSRRGKLLEIEADQQKRQGDLFIADGNVDIRYGDVRLRADHVEYDTKTADASALGHIQFDYLNHHLEAEEAHYNAESGRGKFR